MLSLILIVVLWILLITIVSHFEDSSQLCYAYLILCVLSLYLSWIWKRNRFKHKTYKENTGEPKSKRTGGVRRKMKFLDELRFRWNLALAYADLFMKNKRGESLTNKIIGISIACLVFSVVGVMAINNLNNANTTGWDSTSLAVYVLIPVFMILGVAVAIFYAVKSR